MPTQSQRQRNRRTRAQRERALLATMRRQTSAVDIRIAVRDAEREAARPKPRRRPDPSETLVERGVLSAAQAAAGERLARDWWYSRSEGCVTARYERSSPGHDDPAVHVIAARERYEAAMLAIPADARSVVEHVFVAPRLALAQWNGTTRATREAVNERLRSGLDALREHYARGGA